MIYSKAISFLKGIDNMIAVPRSEPKESVVLLTDKNKIKYDYDIYLTALAHCASCQIMSKSMTNHHSYVSVYVTRHYEIHDTHEVHKV